MGFCALYNGGECETKRTIISKNLAAKEYYVHYQGWNKRHDEWISEACVVGASYKPGSSKYNTPRVRQSRREKKAKKPFDWSPSMGAADCSTERVTVERLPFEKSSIPVSLRLKRSCITKITKARGPSPMSVPKEGIADECVIASDEDEVDCSVPRSYIDVLATAIKRQGRNKLNNGTEAVVISDTDNERYRRSSHSEGASIERSKMEIESNPGSASTSAECHGFAYIGADHNYSSLRFDFDNSAPLVCSVAKEPLSEKVSSSTKRDHILPIRKPLDIQCSVSFANSVLEFGKTAPSLKPTRPINVPPNSDSYIWRAVTSDSRPTDGQTSIVAPKLSTSTVST
ncbi:hypothetical protein Q1695_007468 [Nippostrongylus brasiliensis]|nr:hypothetical protein Q1695_007468 [Nippostrongylus brasiliensis]